MLCVGLVTNACMRLILSTNVDQLVYVCKLVNKEAAPGLDCWPAECLHYVTRAVDSALVHVFKLTLFPRLMSLSQQPASTDLSRS